MEKIYLDTASTTKPAKEVADVINEYLTDKWYNPSSLYGDAIKVKNDLNSAKKTVADFISSKPEEIYFTSGGSEGNCWALQGFVNYVRNHEDDYPVIITSKIEHHSIMAYVDEFKYDADASVFDVPVDKNGFIDIKELEYLIDCFDNDKVLVSIQHANNEIGTIQDIKTISKIVHKYNGVLHCDCTQSFGHIPINVNELGIDMLTASGHKINAPKGIGFLYVRDGVNITPIIFGSQMNGMRGGTENIPYIMGFAKAVELSRKRVQNANRISLIGDYFAERLVEIGCKVNGDRVNRLPNNINVQLPEGVSGEAMLYTLDLSGIQISTGSACNSHSVEPSKVLKAIGLTDEEAARSIRITISSDITMEQIQYVVGEIEKAIKILCS